MDQGTASLDDLRQRLSGRRRVEIRAVLRTSAGDPPSLLHAMAIVGQSARGPARKWSYEGLAFVSDTVSSDRLASIFVAGDEKQLTIASTRASVEFPDTNFMWQKKPSLAQYDQLALPWPSWTYDPRIAQQEHFNMPSYLIGGGDNPSFPTFGTAFNAFFHGNFALTGTGNPSLGEVSVRIIDQRARIQRVRIRPASLDVWIGGRSINGCHLELNGVECRLVVAVVKPGKLSLALPSGLPSDAWLWLKSGNEWLDYRPLNNWGGHTSSDIEVQLPNDPGADISRLATQGEGLHLEYKAKLPDTRDEKRHVFKTVVAFANGAGGKLIFGVEDDGGVCGLPGKLPEARSRLNDLLRDLVTPSLDARIEGHRHDGRNVLVLDVSPNSGVLYGLTVNANRPEYYVRRDGTTFYAQPDEVASIVQRNDSGRAAAWLGPWG
jgi:hypothetical protein